MRRATPTMARRSPSARTCARIGAAFVALLALSHALDLDLVLSSYFYTPTGGWVLGRVPPWSWLYHYGQWPAFLLAAAALAGLLGSRWLPAWRRHRRAFLVIVLAVALGPGLLVNGVLKPLWGRPRPRHVAAFQGTQAYRPWWPPHPPGSGKSFPSGHAAMGYVLAAGAGLAASRRGQRLWLAVALVYGSLMGLARLVQGAHFASDVLGSGAVVFLTLAALEWAIPVAADPKSVCQPPG
ncbi:MAG: phosphatase PAP2 family protein [Candidatus Tectimicrobiota bacterium]|nr:MAG: phosphatase PAP2 family protein [Candidatus Tectomicrobia bacterium]